MNTLCGANCSSCSFASGCAGCEATCGKPFGGDCIAANYIKSSDCEHYRKFKQNLLAEINALLCVLNMPAAEALYELPGFIVNLPYPAPDGGTRKLLSDANIYLGTQISLSETECCGVVADMDTVIISRYGVNGTNPELLLRHERR